MISRVADSCIWLTRYLERLDTWSRLLEVATVFSVDIKAQEGGRWAPIVTVFGQKEHFVETVGESLLEDADAVQEYLVWSETHPASLRSSLRFARENARTSREVISVETWEAINELWIWFQSRQARRLFRTERDGFYQKLCSHCMLVHGVVYSTMLHEDPFTFMKLGRAIERIGQTARIVDVSHLALADREAEQSPAAAAQWLAILRSCSAYEPFFKRADTVLSGSAVADFLIFEQTFPRSVLHNLDRLRGLLLRLRSSEEIRTEPGRAWSCLERFRGSVMQMDIDDVLHVGLHETLTWIVDESARLFDALRADYLEVSLDVQRQRVRLASQSQSQIQGQSQSQSLTDPGQ